MRKILSARAKDDQAFTLITLNIKDSRIPYIQDATTTKDAWAALKEVHQGIGINGKLVLMQRLWALRMTDGEDMAQHLNQFRELANQLQGLSVEGKGMEDSELVTILTLSLSESYEPLVMARQSRSDTVTFDRVAGRLLHESGRRQISRATQYRRLVWRQLILRSQRNEVRSPREVQGVGIATIVEEEDNSGPDILAQARPQHVSAVHKQQNAIIAARQAIGRMTATKESQMKPPQQVQDGQKNLPFWPKVQRAILGMHGS